METVAHRDGDDWVINGVKTWNTGVHTAHSDMVMARTSGNAGDAAADNGLHGADGCAGRRG
jgi:alkylation response protein AidB-like acyl-CoA dehydrogenase